MDWIKCVNIHMAVGVQGQSWPHLCHYFSSSSVPHLLIHPRAKLHGGKSVPLWQASWSQRQGPLCGDAECESSVSLVRLRSLTCHCTHPFSLTRGCTTGSLSSDLPLSPSSLVSDKCSGMQKLPIMSLIVSFTLHSGLPSKKCIHELMKSGPADKYGRVR